MRLLAITLVTCTTLIATTTIADRYRDSVHDQLSRLMLIWMLTNITNPSPVLMQHPLNQ